MFTPVYQPYIWGGDRLRSVLGRTDTPEGIVAESWEVSDREDGMSVVESGPCQGKTLRELLAADPSAILGSRAAGNRFPLLIKILDAEKTLSVQVHPDDETAALHGGEPKTEMWYVLRADPGAAVYCGLEEGTTPETFRRAIEENRLEPLLKKILVAPGDAVFVPGGRVHAIASGCLLLEVQQNSNTTYRIYDWGRMGADGRPRDLHIEQALRVTRWEDADEAKTPSVPLPDLAGMPRRKILQSDYFRLERLELDAEARLPASPESFQTFFVLEGELSVSAGGESTTAPAGRSILLPAAAGEAKFRADNGPARFMRITLPTQDDE